METKLCLKCKETKKLEEFSFKEKKLNKRHCYCKVCFVTLRKDSYSKNKERYIKKSKKRKNEIVEWFVNFKKKLKCEVCGFSHPASLDFHHENDDKENNVSTLVRNGNKEKVILEIEKCRILCSNCHRILHYNQNVENKNIGR